MSADRLLSRLERVRKTGSDRWIARCPAHDDRGPSLSVRELADGRTLLHCFSGCTADEVLDAAGVEFSDLFPERIGPTHGLHRERRPFNAHDVLACVAFEALVASVAAENVAQGVQLSDDDRARLREACGRLQAASELVDGR